MTQISKMLAQSNVQSRFTEMLGKKAPGFISSLLQVVNSNKLLQNADPQTILHAAATAASLDLPINASLGFAYIVPYKNAAQFQLGWKGYTQLALRTGQYTAINVVEVYQNQFRSFNAMTEFLDCDFNTEGSGPVVGYAAYFRLINGFEKTVYWSKEKVLAHAKKYSQSFGKSFSPWSDESLFDSMAKKTVLKNALSKWGIMSIEMQTGILADQSVQVSEGQFEYPDNTPDPVEKAKDEEMERALEWISQAESLDDLEVIKDGFDKLPPAIKVAIDNKASEITGQLVLNEGK